ncbi:fibronectin type III domain-containing protein [Dyadobacter aurulentus]|uniref:fibronectin type III domain-containing protein n=1 Tax=Dyadobacter sp. UC 10 TaxID=2605428 RepID=UPI0011F23F15|nr:fibronectin type III domain-containing protein [Dyadobacter sp. UC 10]KAA0993699.1 T9SS type A sorting domain-containing protein [Dyadobacter sp. UC 10]
MKISFTHFALLLLIPGSFSFNRAFAFLIPKAPTSLTAVASSSSTITVSWVDNSTDETGFELETSADGLKYTKIADLKLNTVSYLHDSLKGATKYWYRIRSRNASGFSPYSNIASVATKTPVTIPKPPAALVATAISAYQIAVTWSDNSSDETGFEVERSVDGLTFTKIADVAAELEIYQNTGLAPATKYWYRVSAKNSAGKSGFSNIATATTMEIPPAVPVGLSGISVSQTQINLSWTDASNNETGFQLERSLNGTAFTKIADLGPNVATYQNVGLTTNTLYYYRIRAVNAAGASAYSNVSSIRTLNIPAPGQPVNFTAVPTEPGLIQLRWAAITGNAVETIIERSKVRDRDFVEISRVAAAVLQFEDKGEFEKIDYYYRIKAINAGGSSPYSLLAIVRASSIITSVEDPKSRYTLYLSGRKLFARLGNTVTGILAVYNMSGREIKAAGISGDQTLDLSGFPSGIYIAVIRTDKEVISRRIALIE